MSDQSQTTTNTPSEPVLCKMGCGFFGNAATSGCCSKCWRESQKKEAVSTATPMTCVEISKPQPVEPVKATLPDAKPSEQIGQQAEAAAAEAPKKPKGKKKMSYKAMMKGMMHTQGDEQKAAQEKEALKKVTGGGAFQKIEKI